MEKKETPTDIDVVHKEDTPSFQELPKETGGIRDEFDYEEEDLDMQIVNELATSEDDTTLVCFTFRSLFTGIILAILSASVSQLMLFKPVSVPLSNTFMMIVAYLICNAWANFLPKGGWLNPGPFNVKENTCIYVLVSAANTSAYGTFILGAQQLYYAHSPGALGGMLLLFSTQIVGYGIAGQLRPFLVYAPNVVWPQSLPTVSFLRTLNTDIDDSKWRTRFFFVVFGGIFVYEFIPQYMFPLLGGISVFCLGKRDSRWFERIFGGLDLNEGMGVLSLSFDWQFLSAYKPLVLPLYVQLNIFSGILIMWIVAPLAYYYNIWDAQKFPFLSNSIYYVNKTTGNSGIYPQEYVLNSDNSLNRTRFEEVGSPKYPTVAALQYVFINLSVTSAIMHVILYYGKDLGGSIRRQWTKKKADQEKMDVHMRLMLAYKEVPSWWYYAIYITGIALNILVAYVNHSQLPWWGVLFAIGMSSVLSLPLNFISAVTGTSFGLNVVAEMICGFVLQGYPVANIYFKTLGFNTMNQAGIMAMDLKIGHYLKVPPRMIFWNQMIGTVIGCIFNYIVNHSIIDNKRDILIGDGDNVWSGAAFHTINSAAITWGAIGPMTMFGPGTMYYIVLWAFVIGFFLPLPTWYLHKRFPTVGFDNINIPMVITGLSFMPGGNSSYVTVSFGIVLFSQWYLKNRHRAWFIKHNYLMSAALDSGTSLMAFFLAMAVQGGGNGKSYPFPTWAGNIDAARKDYCCADCPPISFDG